MTLRSAALLLLAMGTVSLAAQTPPPAGQEPNELVALRKQFEIQALTRAEILTEQFVSALTNIIKESGAEGDYQQALAAQHRRESLLALYSKSLDDAALTNTILLKPSEATGKNGSVTYDRNLDALVTWRTVGSIASWDKSKLTPGTYTVTITYAVADIGEPPNRINPFAPPPDLSTGGEFEFYEDSSLPGAEQNRRSGKVASTGGWTEWKTLTLPPVQITRTSARFALKITSAKGIGGVMNLKGIRLDPAVAAPAVASLGAPNGEPATPPEDEFAQIQTAYQDRLKQVVLPVVTTYTETLKALATKAESQESGAGAEYENEARRAGNLIEDPQSVLTGPAKAAKQGFNVDGFHEIRDAAFIPDESDKTSGDRFKVRAGGEEFSVRLLWVSCPPPDAQERLLKEHAAYFGISTADAQEIGQKALSFTAKFLQGKPLRLFTRNQKDDDGNLLVSVRLNGVGDFAGVLVDNGLAMIKAPGARKGAAQQHENSILHDLREREKAAKARRIPPGGWARAEIK